MITDLKLVLFLWIYSIELNVLKFKTVVLYLKLLTCLIVQRRFGSILTILQVIKHFATLSFEIFACSTCKRIFLWNNCKFFPMLFYEWNEDSSRSQYLDFFLVISLKGTSFFNKGDLFLREGQLHFLLGVGCKTTHEERRHAPYLPTTGKLWPLPLWDYLTSTSWSLFSDVEAIKSVGSLTDNRSSGNDGLSAEFYKQFYLQNCLLYDFRH